MNDNIQTRKEEFRWSLRKKGKQVLTLCKHLVYTAAFATAFSASLAQANPTGGTVTAGSATITSSGSTLNINQHTNRAIIEWGGFDIAAGETTQFVQPGASSVALNRVVNANQASVINGNLLANGKVLVINPNGVLIGAQGNVDVAGFVASTADIDNDKFMNAAGAMSFDKAGRADAVVENKGRITIGDEGLGLLVAPTVRNSGLIEGNLAKVQLGAGDTFGVDLYGDGLLHLAVNSDAPRTVSAENTGTIVANAGKVVMTAAAASNVVKSVINNEGVIEAKGLVSKGGEIILTGAGATVKVSGKLDASGKTGGGKVKIGGDYQGGGTLAKADETHVTETATVKANAEELGDGGTIVVWAEKLAEATGKFFAQGGALGGNGGLVETSSKGGFFFDGIYVNALAPKGKAGTWLLDPQNIDIVAAGVSYDPALHNNGATAGNVSIGVSSINNALANVYLTAGNNIRFGMNVNIAASGVGITAVAGNDVLVATGISITTNNGDVTFSAGKAVTLNNGSAITTNGGDVSFSAGSDVSFKNGNSIATNGGNVTVTLVDDPNVFDNEGDKFSANNTRISTNGGHFGLNILGGVADFVNTTINTTGGGSAGLISVWDATDSNITASELGNNNNFYSGNYGGNIGIAAYDVKQSNNNCFKAGGAGSCAAVPDPAYNLTITAPNQYITYGSMLFDPLLYSVSAGALLAGDSLTGNLTRANPGTWTVGTYAIQKGTVGVTGAGTYNITWDLGNFIINPAFLTITANNRSKTYGDLLDLGTTAFTASGLQFSDAVTGVTLASAGAPATAYAGNYAINASDATGFGLGNYVIAYLPGTFTVDPKTLTITANSFNKEYGNAYTFTGNEYSVNGLVNGDAVTGVTIDSTGAVAGANVGGYNITAVGASGLGLANYMVNYVNGTLTVTPAPLSVQTLDRSKVYGTGIPTGGAGSFVNLTGLKNGDYLTAVIFNGATYPALASTSAGVGTYAYNASSVVLNNSLSNYAVTYLPGTLTITPKALTVIANDQFKAYGDAFTFTGTEFSAPDLINGDTITSVDLFSFGANSFVQTGTYDIVASNAVGFGLGNYTISYQPGKFTVSPKLLTITANSFNKEYGDAYIFAGNEFTANGLVNGDTVSGVSLASTGAFANTYAGDYSITPLFAFGFNPANYNVQYVNGIMTVTPAPLLVTPNAITKVYGQGYPGLGGFFPYVTAIGLKNGDYVKTVGTSEASAPELYSATASVGTYDFNLNTFDVSSSLSNYSVTYAPGSLTITPRALTVTANSINKVYGSDYAFLGTEFSASGLVNGDTVDAVDLASAGAVPTANVGGYGISASNAVGTGLSNYVITYVDGVLTVTPARLLVQAHDQSKTYGDAFTFNGTEFSVVGGSLYNGDTVDAVDLASAGADPAAWVNNYAIGASNATGSGLSNYDIQYLDGTMTVNPALLTLTALDQMKAYGTSFVFAGNEYAASGLVNGDTVSGVTLSSLGSPALATPGTYAIDISGATGKALSNYNVVYVNGTMTIPVQPFTPFQVAALGRPVVSVANQAIVLDRAFEGIDTAGRQTNVSIALNNAPPMSAQALANIAPAAGGAEDLANIEPAAGGEGAPSYTGDIGCANDFLDNRPCGAE